MTDKDLGGKKIEYGVKSFRISDELYLELQNRQQQSGKSWNRFFQELLEKAWMYEDLCK